MTRKPSAILTPETPTKLYPREGKTTWNAERHRMADEGQVDCQRWTYGGRQGLLDGEVSEGRGAGEGKILL